MSRFTVSLLFRFAAVLALASGAFADTIVSVTGTANSGYPLGEQNGYIFEASWTTATAYSNVSIAAEVGNYGAEAFDAYLTTTVGPTETAADQIASLPDFSPATENEVDTLFSGLDLPPGTYYLVLADNDPNLFDVWLGNPGATPATAAGVTFDGDGYATNLPDTNPLTSTFTVQQDLGLFFQVTGDASSLPEPGSLSLNLIGGFGGLWLWKHRRSS
jgi:hypothetical protein